MRIAVAVGVRAASTTWDLCLLALRSEGVEPLVLDVPKGQGLAQARNAALAATVAEVLAFVDDDVAVEPGWLAALHEAWLSAPDDCAFIGGAIGVRFTGPRPRWLTDELLGVLGVAEGERTSFHGGNVSFRTEALRGIQGFWPARGRPELHDWFSEEHYAQHELTAAGWSHGMAGEARAVRIVDPAHLRRRDLVKRRARYGARSALIGSAGRARRRAGRGVEHGRSGGRRGVRRWRARHRARRARRRERRRAGRAAHRPPRPPAQRDAHALPPFRAARAPMLARRPLRRERTGPLVLLYHRIGDGPGSVTPANFAAQIEMLLARYTAATLEAIALGDAAPDAFAVTFDDGYAETMRRALPVLISGGVPATIFVSTEHVATQRGFWWDEVRRLLQHGRDRPLRLTLDGEVRSWARAGSAERHVVAGCSRRRRRRSSA